MKSLYLYSITLSAITQLYSLEVQWGPPSWIHCYYRRKAEYPEKREPAVLDRNKLDNRKEGRNEVTKEEHKQARKEGSKQGRKEGKKKGKKEGRKQRKEGRKEGRNKQSYTDEWKQD